MRDTPWMYTRRVGLGGIIALVGSAAEEDERRELVEETIQPRPGVTVTVQEAGPFALRGGA